MSLVGNLEDLSLGDITQIISLSQKSGVLVLEGAAGAGRIVFQSGLVFAASVKGQSRDLRSLLVDGDHVEAALFDACAERARESGLSVVEVLTRESELGCDRIEEVIRGSVESAILEMFLWPSGEFSFDVRSELDDGEPELILSSGINAQYLAMEGMRLRDERARDGAATSADPNETRAASDSPLDVEGMFGDEPLDTILPDSDSDAGEIPLELDEGFTATDALVETVVARADSVSVSGTSGESGVGESCAETVPDAVGHVPEPEAAAPPRSNPAMKSMPVVLIEPDISALEWMKTALVDDFGRVHVFQQAEQGLARIRQYLIRGELPLVLISLEAPIDPLSGIHGLTDFVSRLKAQSRRLVVLAVYEDDEERKTSVPGVFDAAVARPRAVQLLEGGEADSSSAARELVDRLGKILSDRSGSANPPDHVDVTGSSTSLEDLKAVTRRLQDASSRGEVLPVVLAFASRIFARVAILIVREQKVFAIAGQGIPSLEVDPLGNTPPVALDAEAEGWIKRVLDSGEPLTGPPTTPADRALLTRLGGELPAAAYLGPIGSGGATVALVYGDQHPDGGNLPDTSGLEVVLHHAGLALDRAALERALWEADERSV